MCLVTRDLNTGGFSFLSFFLVQDQATQYRIAIAVLECEQLNKDTAEDHVILAREVKIVTWLLISNH